ncbi:uncharacterized protein LOC134288731 [Aedes albopictus]|uniref:Uncharacterized protein n=1 Tax=Aedes albopictus TaxID=7160 RepID=A0ABM1XYE9_AEDAL
MEEQRQLQLTNRRTTLMASLGRAEQFVSKYQADRDQAQVPLRIENIDNVWMGLEDVQTQLEELDVTEEGREQNNQIRSKFESVYFKVKAALNSLLPASPIQTPNAIPNPPANLLSGIKLPTISLPEFDGDYNQWLAFHDTFVALIHGNADVPDVQKFHYLRAALKGEAAQLIESIAISSANYTVAWQTLTTRYANDYLLKKRHLQALLDCPRMKRESAEALHSLVDEYQRHTKILRQLQEPVDHWSTMLEHLLCIRLDDGTLKAWEDHATTVANPNYTCLVDFLQRRIRVLESMSVNHQSHNSQTPVNHAPLHRKSIFHKVATHTVAEDQPKCYACNEYHFLIKCPRFEKMNVSDRMRLIDNNRLCQNCFRHDHFARNCQSKYSCRHCQRRHHTLSSFPQNQQTRVFTGYAGGFSGLVESSVTSGEATSVVAGSSGGGSDGEKSKLEEMQPGGRNLESRPIWWGLGQTDRHWTAWRETVSRDGDGFAWTKCNRDSQTRMTRPTRCGYGNVGLPVLWSKMANFRRPNAERMSEMVIASA